MKSKTWTGYVVAILSTAAAYALARSLYRPWVELSPLFLFYGAVALSSWYGGVGPGLLAIVLGAITADYSLMAPAGAWHPVDPYDIARLIVFAILGVMIAILNGALHRANRQCGIEAQSARASETRAKSAEAEAKLNQRRLRAVGNELMMAEERERRRIATVLHDSVVQMLASAKMRVGAIKQSPQADPAISRRLEEIHELIDSAIAQTRTLTADLSPPVLYELGLAAAIQWLGDRLRAEHGIAFELTGDRQTKPLTEETRVTLYQAVRELMNNVVRHAHAGKCAVHLIRDEQAGAIRISVEDDGRGVSPSSEQDYSKGGFGLFNIRQRLTHLGGSLQISPGKSAGTIVSITAPLALADPKAKLPAMVSPSNTNELLETAKN